MLSRTISNNTSMSTVKQYLDKHASRGEKFEVAQATVSDIAVATMKGHLDFDSTDILLRVKGDQGHEATLVLKDGDRQIDDGRNNNQVSRGANILSFISPVLALVGQALPLLASERPTGLAKTAIETAAFGAAALLGGVTLPLVATYVGYNALGIAKNTLDIKRHDAAIPVELVRGSVA